MMLGQTPTSGDFWNPTNWGPFIHEIGQGGFFALVFLAYIVWKEWRGSKQPSNKQQVRLLKLMYADAMGRNVRLRKVLRAFCDVCVLFAMKAGCEVEVKTRLERVQDALDASPPPVPEELALDDNDDNDKE